MFRKYIAIATVVSGVSYAQDKRFNTNTGELLRPPTASEIKEGIKRTKISPELKVPDEWLPYVNPSFKEFWTEGDRKADAGFILFARNPTLENAKLWLIRMETKAAYTHQMWDLVEKAQKELIKDGVIEDRYGTLASLKTKLVNESEDYGKLMPKDTIIYFVFNDTCPVCKKQAVMVLSKVKKYVKPMQIVRNGVSTLAKLDGLNQSQWLDAETKNLYLKNDMVVPIMLIFNATTKKMTKLVGYKDLPDLVKAAQYVSK
jgi:hypothetical protein